MEGTVEQQVTPQYWNTRYQGTEDQSATPKLYACPGHATLRLLTAMQQLAPVTRVLIYAGLTCVALVALLAFVRIVQQLILIHRETGSLFTWKPDTPALRRFQRVNNLLFGSIQFIIALSGACAAVWVSWFCFQNGNARVGKLTIFLGLPIMLIVMFTGAYTVWKSFHQHPAESDEILEVDDILDIDNQG